MNEFTKDELLEIKFVFEQWNYPLGKYPRSEDILNKIQSLIDNYCEHEMGYGGSQEVYQCKKCGEIE